MTIQGEVFYYSLSVDRKQRSESIGVPGGISQGTASCMDFSIQAVY